MKSDPPESIRPNIARITDLQQLIADFAAVLRVPQLADSGRPENDVDHSFGLALTCWFLAPKIAPHLNLEKILSYALAHDIVEIYAGDTFAFGDKQLRETKSDREDKAIRQLAKEWPDFPELVDYAAGYKEKRDEAAKFVYAVDKLLPILMVNLGEKNAFWERHKISLEMMKKEKQNSLAVSDEVAPYYAELVAWMLANDYFYKPSSG